MKVEFTRHIFVTITYDRNYTILEAWKSCSKDFNRYIQTSRRFFNHKIQYLRVIEEQSSGYPHVHAIFQFSDARIRIENTKYFDRSLFKKMHSHWKHGFADFKRIQKKGHLLYILKYLVKNTTCNTIFKKILPKRREFNFRATEKTFPPVVKFPIKKNGVKLCTWSRHFDFTPFLILHKNRTNSQALQSFS